MPPRTGSQQPWLPGLRAGRNGTCGEAAHTCVHTHAAGRTWAPGPLRRDTLKLEGRVRPSLTPTPPPPCRQQLSEEELERLEEACDMALELNASKHRIYEYVESRMSFIAPNLSIIIGASTAAKIMGEARPHAVTAPRAM